MAESKFTQPAHTPHPNRADECRDTTIERYRSALAVVKSLATEHQECGLVFAARNLMAHDLDDLKAALRGDEDELNQASSDLDVVVALLMAATCELAADDGNDGVCMGAALTLARQAKQAIDEMIQILEAAEVAA